MSRKLCLILNLEAIRQSKTGNIVSPVLPKTFSVLLQHVAILLPDEQIRHQEILNSTGKLKLKHCIYWLKKLINRVKFFHINSADWWKFFFWVPLENKIWREKMIRMKSACFAHLCLKFIDFFLEFGGSVNWDHV